jgi:hypothetical protein
MLCFYHCFHTDLPDQFVEANARHLTRWTDKWRDNPYLVRSRIIDGVSIDLLGKTKNDDWPTLKCGSQRMLDLWMHNKGENYNGGYWGTLTEDQRDPYRVASGAGGNLTIDPGTVTGLYASAAAAASRRFSTSIVWVGEDRARPRHALKRDGVIAGEIVGYRCWRIENGLLRSVYQTDVWQPREILAGRELGDWDQRGIHAWKDSGSNEYHDYIRSYLNRENDPFSWVIIGSGSAIQRGHHTPRPAMVTGTVFLWGDVVEHQRGYRAEYARVRSLDWLYPDAPMMGREEESLNQLRAKYGVLA